MFFEIPTDVLRAVAQTASNEATRYYLNGVFIDASGRIVSTDGKALTVAVCPVLQGGGESHIIPIDAVTRALAGHKNPTIGFEWGSQLGAVTFAPVDGSFPDYTRIVPQEAPTGVGGQFAPELLTRLGKQAVFLGGKGASPYIHHDGENPASVSFRGRPEVTGILMPLHGTQKAPPIAYVRPAWAA